MAMTTPPLPCRPERNKVLGEPFMLTTIDNMWLDYYAPEILSGVLYSYLIFPHTILSREMINIPIS